MELWHVPLGIDPEMESQAWQVLDAAERERAGRFRMATHRRAYVAAHAALRRILGQALGEAPESLRFVHGAAGKPALAGQGAQGLRFNLSHSGQRAVVAWGRRAELGVDLEIVDPEPHALAELEHVFSPAERAAVAACEPAQQPMARLRCWVRKEALLKAAGCGFGDEVRQLTVSVTAQAQLIDSHHPDITPGAWLLAGFEQPGSWVGALAVAGALPRVAVHQWDWRA